MLTHFPSACYTCRTSRTCQIKQIPRGAANIARLSFDEISRAVWPFVLAMLLALGVITEWPALSAFLPALFGLT